MVNVWICSDLHFGHENILDYSKEARPFPNIDTHDAKLIQNWNSVVRPKDKVIVAGDFFVGPHTEEQIDEVMKQLNGEIELIEGNHDSAFRKKILSKYIKKISAYKVIRENKYDSIISHIPVHPQQLESRYKSNLHGHLHKHNVMIRTPWVDNAGNIVWDTELDQRYINVSMEQINLTPINMDIIRQRIGDLP